MEYDPDYNGAEVNSKKVGSVTYICLLSTQSCITDPYSALDFIQITAVGYGKM